MLPLLLLSSFFIHAVGVIVSDTGCACATVKNNITTPAAASTIAVGCTVKTDWTGTQSTWCLTDQTTACGTQQPGFGYADYCTQASITPNVLATTVFTGQPFNISWTSTSIVEPELFRVGYPGRSLGSANVSKGYVSIILADTITSLSNVLLTVNTTNPLVTSVIPGFSIVQSKIQQAWVYNQGVYVPPPTGGGGGGGGTTTIPCDGRNLTFIWLGVGNALTGNASVVIKSNGGGGGGGGGTTYVGTAVQIPAVNPSGNTSINYVCPRTFVAPGFGTTYVAAITVQTPTTVYTLNSPSFGLSTAPTPSTTPSITPSQTPTISVTPTPSLSFGATSSITPSGTPTPSQTSSITPSQTPTISVTATNTPSSSSTPSYSPTNTQTPSETPTPRSIIQIGSINTQQFVDTPTLVGSIVGSAAALVAIFGIVRLYQRRQLNKIRRARLKAASRRAVTDRQAIYGVAPESAATVVMHQYGPQPTGRHPRRPNSLTSPQRV